MRKTIKPFQINIKQIGQLVACLMVFLPCILSVVSSQFITKTIILLAYWGMAILIGLFSVQSNMVYRLDAGQRNWLFTWMILFAIMVLNNNGDLQQGSYTSLINYFMILAFAMLVVMNRKFEDKYVLIAMMVLLGVQLIAGYYYWVYPSKLLSLKNIIAPNGGYALTSFLNGVNQGAFMGLTSHYSTSGMYMSLGTVIAAGLLLVNRSKTGKFNIFLLIILGLFFIALVLTQKRAHLLFGVMTVLLMYLIGYVKGGLKKKLKQITAITIAAIVIFAVAMQVPAFASTFERFAEFFDGSADLNDMSSNRIDKLWIPAWKEFLEHPIMGMGWRQFKYVHPMSAERLNDCHNIYLQLLCETGIVGTVIFMSVILYTYWLTWKTLEREKYNVNSVCYYQLMYSFGYQTFFLLYGLTGNPLYDIQCIYPYIIACVMTYKYSQKAYETQLAGQVQRFHNKRTSELTLNLYK